MSKEKRGKGRPRVYKRIHGDDTRTHAPLTLRKDLIAQMDAEIETHSKVLGFKINRQQFMEVMLTHWENTREDK